MFTLIEEQCSYAMFKLIAYDCTYNIQWFNIIITLIYTYFMIFHVLHFFTSIISNFIFEKCKKNLGFGFIHLLIYVCVYLFFFHIYIYFL